MLSIFLKSSAGLGRKVPIVSCFGRREHAAGKHLMRATALESRRCRTAAQARLKLDLLLLIYSRSCGCGRFQGLEISV